MEQSSLHQDHLRNHIYTVCHLMNVRRAIMERIVAESWIRLIVICMIGSHIAIGLLQIIRLVSFAGLIVLATWGLICRSSMDKNQESTENRCLVISINDDQTRPERS